MKKRNHQVNLITAKGNPAKGYPQKGIRERAPSEVVHYWKERERDQVRGHCAACGIALGQGPAFYEAQEKWADHPKRCSKGAD